MRQYQTPIHLQWNTNTVKSRTSTLPSAIYSPRGRWHNSTLGYGTSTPEVRWHSENEGWPRDGKWESNPASTRSVLRRFSVGKDIMRPVPPFARFVISRPSRFFHGSIVNSCHVKVIRSCTRSLASFLFSSIFCLSSLFVPIKVFCRSVT